MALLPATATSGGVHAAAAQLRLWRGLVAPVGLASPEHEEGALGPAELVIDLAAGIQQKDAAVRVLSEAGGKDASSRSGADDHVVV